MTWRGPPAARWEIYVDGVPRTHRDRKEVAIEAARELQVRNKDSKLTIVDNADGTEVAFDPWGK